MTSYQEFLDRPENENNPRTGLTTAAIKQAFIDDLYYDQGRNPIMASPYDRYMALAFAVRDRMQRRAMAGFNTYFRKDIRIVCYLSAEFLLGPHLANNLINLGILDQTRQALSELGMNLDDLVNQEEEPGLGNGGLGRLAACYMDSLATLQIPAIGYGIRYEFGIFDQEIRNGWQVEITDKWLRLGNPWEIPHPELAFDIHFGGHTQAGKDEKGCYRVKWIPHRAVKGIAFDTPILGYRVNTCNVLRLWKAEAPESFDFQAFNVGDYYRAVDEKVYSENITKVLYPNDEQIQGKQLRLEQQYFFVSCSLQDMIRLCLLQKKPLDLFHELYTVQLNDTHPAIAVAELMRLLVDVHEMDWDTAWAITQKTFAYTNHTLMPEALEKWPLPLFQDLLPRHLEIIFEINRRFLDDVRAKFPGDEDRIRRMSIIDEAGPRFVRMAHLACVGSHAVNGVAELHTELLERDTLHDFYQMWPEKFSNKTNGVTPRRWMVLCNPKLSSLITGKIGDRWISHLEEELRQLEAFADDPDFQRDWDQVTFNNKCDLASHIKKTVGLTVNPDSIFDIQVKRIHEYKRQHLNVLHIITLYNLIRQNPNIDIVPRTFIFGGKAAPGYFMAKLIIKLINAVADVVNNDPDVRDRLKVVFLPDFNVTNGQRIYPAADLSEQISTAGKEASGTGNMKFSLNGALTIGTLDGANIEIRQEVGEENFFLFGLTAGQVDELNARGYNPWNYYHANAQLRQVIDMIRTGHFSHDNPDLFKPLVESLMNRDSFMLFADYQSYIECQHKVSLAFRDRARWTKMSILNVARMGKFSSDRAIREYAGEIWNVKPVPVELNNHLT
jgi:glycogen phosphorylase